MSETVGAEKSGETGGSDVVTRKARCGDIVRIQSLINAFADRKLMLPRSLGELYDNLRDFHVAQVGERIVGCVTLHPVWDNLAEVKSLAVEESRQGQRLGSLLVELALDEARSLGFSRVFVLTYRATFFKRLGFEPVDKNTLPHKVWFECTRCPLFPDCDEEALALNL